MRSASDNIEVEVFSIDWLSVQANYLNTFVVTILSMHTLFSLIMTLWTCFQNIFL